MPARDESGETLVETLIAVLVSFMAMLLLSMAISVAVNIINESENTGSTYYRNTTSLAELNNGATGQITVSGTGTGANRVVTKTTAGTTLGETADTVSISYCSVVLPGGDGTPVIAFKPSL